MPAKRCGVLLRVCADSYNHYQKEPHKQSRVYTDGTNVRLSHTGRILCAAVAVTVAAIGGDEPSKPFVSDGDLLKNPVAANWPSYNGDYSGRRFSALSEITPANAANLRAQWVFHSRNSSNLELTPAVMNGIMYVTSANDAFALDASTGREIWHYSRPVTEGLIDDASAHHSRGVALWRSRVYIQTDNAHLLCLDARSGHLIWDVAYATGNKN